MKILVVCQYYSPEPFRIGDLCAELVRRGHEVTVFTGEPNYPEGKLYPGYEKHQRADELIDGVRVHRCRIIPRRSGFLFRLLNYYSYPLSAIRELKRFDRTKGSAFDLVFVNQLSPVMMAQPAIAYHRRHGVPVLMYCLDLWPVSLRAGGVRESSALYRFFRAVSRRIYRSMDRILVTSRLFRDYLSAEFGIPEEKTGYLPQYAEGVFDALPSKTKQGGPFELLFAGNIGAAQSVQTVLAAAERLRDEPVSIRIVGGGTELDSLKKTAEEKQLENVSFYGRRPLAEMPAFYARADAFLVTLRADPALSLTLPGKVQSYMAAGKPILGAIDGETAEVIRAAGCGSCVPAEDAAALAEAIRAFVRDPAKEDMGRRARAYYDEHFRQSVFMDRLENEMLSLIGKGQS